MKQVVLLATVVLLASLALAPQAGAVLHECTVYDIQMGMIPVGDSVHVDSVIVTAIDAKPTTYGITVQEIPGGPYSGVLAYMGGQRPDTVGGVGLACGDLVTVVGRIAEYAAGSASGTLTEIDWVHVTLVQEDYGELSPQLMTCRDIGLYVTDSLCAEQWESVWLAVDTVRVTAHLTNGEMRVVEAHTHNGVCNKDTLTIDDKLITDMPRPNVGDSLALIKGVLWWEYDTYRLCPRSVDDMVYIGDPPGPNMTVAYPVETNKIDVRFDQPMDTLTAEDPDNYGLSSGTAILSASLDVNDGRLIHLTTNTMPTTQLDVLSAFYTIESAFGVPMDSTQTYTFRAGICPISFVQTPANGDTSQCNGQQVTVTGIVSTATTAFGGEYFVQKRSGGAGNGIYIYQFTNTFSAGDSVVVSGVVQEYYNMTEMSGIDYQKRIPVAAPVKITKVTPATIKNSSPTAEDYESVMVKLDSVSVYSLFDINYEWMVGTGTDSVMIGTHGVYTYVPGLGSTVSVQGPLDYSYGEFKIQPRDDGDITVVTACTAGAPKPGELALSLSQNTPNPFGGETSIRFTVPEKTRVNLAIFDVTGRLVSSVYQQELAAGEYHATWTGKDSSGSRVSPGVYFVRLATPERSIEKKMVLVE
ncbi:MAG: T9SS type A sorting domain-containing protein [bacterium]